MPELQNALEKKGWFLTPEAIKDCSNDNRNVSADSVIKTALDLDIRGMCKKILPDGVGRSTSNKVPYPLVLQVIKITNIAAPSSNQESQTAPPLLRIHLSDGHSTCTALDISSIQGLSLKTFPGTKICLKAEVQARNGMLLLTNENAKLLGGNVEKLIRKGKAGQALIKTSSDGGSSGPPAFIPFQEYIKNNPNMAKQETTKVNSSNSSKNFKQQQGNNHNRTEKSYNKDARSGYSKS
ncbi:uncharacterized protein TRIADDRAFT_60006 [Trichoplax adhaerens]|uniref:RecQ mediated genome instability protein 1 OB-fold domain-containing protein n=1 Tax=Trichoplax adhaerens TaxID=10228 RepID=B3S719_TRIAD|nr:hypothetical protein TRIADDRAFT_60006 [Trichoplax adhaerens]EDV21409.1 hypothetical protein TRIADDRAFT_60006 [Trichoplax adhaerens]|eukprot:XP_002116009.1 hypothetical protein TRIADDRAFT_60006 [Trichoplax adhaerens]